MHDLVQFSPRDMVLWSRAPRRYGAGAFCVEEAARQVVTYLYENLVQPEVAIRQTSKSDVTACGRAQELSPVFLEPNASATPFVRAEAGFLLPLPVRAILGFGGHQPSRSAFVAMLFSTVAIDAEQAARFTTIALSIKFGHPALRWADDLRINGQSICEEYL